MRKAKDIMEGLSVSEDWIEIGVKVDVLTELINKGQIDIEEFEERHNQLTKQLNNLYWKTKRHLENKGD